jgi:ribosomal protein S18 acetylase RimI-like enzyme
VIEIRVLTPGDWAVWRRIRLRALAEAPHAFGSRLSDWQGKGDREERWRARLAVPGSHNLIAALDGVSVGMASGVPGEQEGAAELVSMWVSPEARGRGVADRLISEVERWSLERRAEVIRLAVTPGNEHALALYRRNGFEDTGELGDLMPDGASRERILSKKLS